MASIAENWSALRARLRAAGGGRKITAIAVAKTFPAAAVARAAAAGVVDIGENYLQEAEEKIAACAGLPLVWHFVGAIQRNKTARIAALFDWAHAIDREEVGRRLSAARAGKPPLQAFMQVNLWQEAGKAGVAAAQAPALARALAALPNIRLRGLMALPPPAANAARQQAAFNCVAALQANICKTEGLPLDCLSMGMSADFEPAIRAGATHVRLGTALFGARAGKRPPAEAMRA